MSVNNRIFYSCQGVAIQGFQDTTISAAQMVHGLQSVGITTNFNLEQAFEIGQLEIYENIEGTPDVEVSLEKVLDGYPLIYHMATQDIDALGASGISARSKARCNVRLGIFDEAENNIAGQDAEVEVYMSGMYVSSISYSMAADGNFTESVTLVGNNKEWLTGAATTMQSASIGAFNGADTPFFDRAPNTDEPLGGIQRREDFIMSGCILPLTMDGIVSSNYGNGVFDESTNKVHLQSVSISTDFSRDDVLELGRKTPYYRPANFPIEVTCDIEAITISGDFIGAYEFGDPAFSSTANSGNNLTDDTIFIVTRQGYAWDLGAKNKISSVSYGGGDAGGGNASVTYSYSNFNELDVQFIKQNGGYLGFGALSGLSNAALINAYDWSFTIPALG